MSRLHAFTLVEVLVSLFLVALLGVFAVSAITSVSQDQRGLDLLSSGRMNVLWLCTRLRSDLDRAELVTRGPEGTLTLALGDGPIAYTLSGDTVVRVALSGRETFVVGPENAVVEDVPFAPGLVGTWVLQLGPDGPAAPLVFHKTYDAATITRYIVDHAHTR